MNNSVSFAIILPKHIDKIFCEGKRFYNLDNREIDLILNFIFNELKNKYDKLYSLIKLQDGTPYQNGCLGEEKKPDEDPIFRLDTTDCTVFILTTQSLLHSSNIKQARENIIIANYRPRGNPREQPINSELFSLHHPLDNYVVSYSNRLHFTTDRLQTSPFNKDITLKIAGNEKTIQKKIGTFSNSKAKNTLIKISADGKRLLNIDWEKEIEIIYIPNQFITKKLLKRFPKICGVAFTKEKYFEMGLDVGHEGFLIEGKKLFHASSEHKKVVEVDFFNYYFREKNKPRFDGIIIFEIL